MRKSLKVLKHLLLSSAVHLNVYAAEPELAKQWYLYGGNDYGLDLMSVIDQFPKGEEVIVAVIDNGVDVKNPDLKGKMWINEGEIPGDGIDNDKNGYVDDIHGIDILHLKHKNDKAPLTKDEKSDEYKSYQENKQPRHEAPVSNHGTHIAGVIAANQNNNYGIFGIANNVKIMTIRAIPERGKDEEGQDLAAAINYAVDHGAKILNCSFSQFTNPIEAVEALKYAEEKGVLIITSSGNGFRLDSIDLEKKPAYLASYRLPNLITVASSKQNGTGMMGSNYGAKTVHVAVPGDKIFSLDINNGFEVQSGTSMATGIMSGVAALVWGSYPELTYSQLKELLITSIKENAVWSKKGRLPIINPGVLNLPILVKRLKGENLSDQVKQIESHIDDTIKKNKAAKSAKEESKKVEVKAEVKEEAKVEEIKKEEAKKEETKPVARAKEEVKSGVVSDLLNLDPSKMSMKDVEALFADLMNQPKETKAEPVAPEANNQKEPVQAESKPVEPVVQPVQPVVKPVESVAKPSETVKPITPTKKPEVEIAPIDTAKINDNNSNIPFIGSNEVDRQDNWLLVNWPHYSTPKALRSNDGTSFDYDVKSDSELTEKDYHELLSRITGLYKPLIEKYGYTFELAKNWSSDNIISTESASADRNDKTKKMKLTVMGNIAKFGGMTKDSFSLIVCHEMGHLIAPGPGKGRVRSDAATEGEADYFAAQICLKQLWENQEQLNSSYAAKIAPAAKELCDISWNNSKHRSLCYRIVHASYANVSLRHKKDSMLGGPGPLKINVLTPDQNVVAETDTDYPATYQCQLDSLIAGALCNKGLNYNSVPSLELGIMSFNDPKVQQFASKFTCSQYAGDLLGNRPKCWYNSEQEFAQIQSSKLKLEGMRSDGTFHPGDILNLSIDLKNNSSETLKVLDSQLNISSPKISVSDSLKIDLDGLSGSEKISVSKKLKIETDATCGEKVSVNLNMSTDKGSVSYAESFILGKEMIREIGASNQVFEVSYKGTGISSIANSSNAVAAKAEIEIDMFHENPIDYMEIFLVSPSGKQYTLPKPEYIVADCFPAEMLSKYPEYSKYPCTAQHLRKTMNKHGSLVSKHVIPVFERSSAGDWKLKVVEKGMGRASVKSWKLNITEAHCAK